MANKPLIRFSCSCGKRLAARVKHAGQDTTCPKCKQSVHVPTPPGAGASTVSPDPVAPCGHPRLDDLYRVTPLAALAVG